MLNDTCSSVCNPAIPPHVSNPPLSMSTSTHPSNQISNPMTFFWKAPRLRKRAKRRRAPRTRGRARLPTGQRNDRLKRKWTSCWWVRHSHKDKNKPAHNNMHVDPGTWCVCWHAGVQQGAGKWIWQLWRLAPHFQLVQRKGRGRRRARSGWRQDCWQIQGGKTLSKNKYVPT